MPAPFGGPRRADTGNPTAPRLRQQLRRIDTAENAQAREIEALAHLSDPHAPAIAAMRSRHLARFTELEHERAQIDKQLAGLARTTRQLARAKGRAGSGYLVSARYCGMSRSRYRSPPTPAGQ